MAALISPKRITVIAAPIALGIAWWVWLNAQHAAIEVLVATVVIVAAAVWYVTLRNVAVSDVQQQLHRQEFWRFLITPLVFSLSIVSFLLILEAPTLSRVVVIGGVVAMWFLLQNMFDRFYRAALYPPQSFEVLSLNINSVSLFLLLTTAYSFITFLRVPAGLIAIIFLLVIGLLTYQTMWISGVTLRKGWLYIVIISLLHLELFWVLVFLPNTYYLKALLILVSYYVMINIARNHLIGVLTNTMVWRYVVIAAMVVAFALGTAQWL